VLGVDDDVDAAASLCTLLQCLGCEAACAFDRREALRLADVFGPEIAILDLEMPDADGCDVLRQLRDGEDAGSSVLHVCLTGSNSVENRHRCEAAGFDHFYGKPIRAQEISALLAEGASRRARRAADPSIGSGGAAPPRGHAGASVGVDITTPAPTRPGRGIRPRLT